MKHLIPVLAAVALTATAAFAQTDHSAHGQMSPASQSYMDAMTKMDADMKAMKMTGKAGVDFALMMIPHHQSAIDMAKLVPERAAHQELKDLSKNVIDSQSGEIDKMNSWLANWYSL